MTETTDPQPDRRETVEYFLQSRQPDDSWAGSSAFMDDREWAEDRLATRLAKMPQFEHRLVRRTTTVVVEPVDGSAPAAVPSASADRAGLRDRIAEALYERERPIRWAPWADALAMDRETFEAMADAVLAVLPATTDRTAVPPEDDEDGELVCVDECGSCDACGMEPFGSPAEGWREAARFLRRTPRDSADYPGALRGARLIEDELRRMADEAPQPETGGCWCGHSLDRHWSDEGGRMTFPDGCHDCSGWNGAHAYGQELPWATDEQPAAVSQPGKEA